MRSSRNSYAGYRYPGEIIAHAVWLYHRFCLSFRDVEDLLAERGITVSHETIRQWRTVQKLDRESSCCVVGSCGSLSGWWRSAILDARMVRRMVLNSGLGPAFQLA
jgi:putative transposase